MGCEEHIPSLPCVKKVDPLDQNPALAGFHKLVAKHSSQPKQAGAEQAQRAGLGNGRRVIVVVFDRYAGAGIRSLARGKNATAETFSGTCNTREIKCNISLPDK